MQALGLSLLCARFGTRLVILGARLGGSFCLLPIVKAFLHVKWPHQHAMRPRRGVARLPAPLCLFSVLLASLACATVVRVQDASELLNAFTDASVSRIEVVGWINLVAGVVLRQAVLLGPNRNVEVTAANWTSRQNESELVALVAGIDFGRNAGLLRLQDNTTLTLRGLEIRNSLSLLGYDFAAVEPQAGCVWVGPSSSAAAAPPTQDDRHLAPPALLSTTPHHNWQITTHRKCWPAGPQPQRDTLPHPRTPIEHCHLHRQGRDTTTMDYIARPQQ